jgi:hypothetical protein
MVPREMPMGEELGIETWIEARAPVLLGASDGMSNARIFRFAKLLKPSYRVHAETYVHFSNRKERCFMLAERTYCLVSEHILKNYVSRKGYEVELYR